MNKFLTKELKQNIQVKVNLSYSFKAEYGGIDRMANILKEYGLEPIISDGYYYGPSRDLKCKGVIDLLSAEIISKQFHLIPTHIEIKYSPDGGFSLIA